MNELLKGDLITFIFFYLCSCYMKTWQAHVFILLRTSTPIEGEFDMTFQTALLKSSATSLPCHCKATFLQKPIFFFMFLKTTHIYSASNFKTERYVFHNELRHCLKFQAHVWKLIKTYWKSRKIADVLLCLFLAACSTLSQL